MVYAEGTGWVSGPRVTNSGSKRVPFTGELNNSVHDTRPEVVSDKGDYPLQRVGHFHAQPGTRGQPMRITLRKDGNVIAEGLPQQGEPTILAAHRLYKASLPADSPEPLVITSVGFPGDWASVKHYLYIGRSIPHQPVVVQEGLIEVEISSVS
jgi:hypothetical protein